MTQYYQANLDGTIALGDQPTAVSAQRIREILDQAFGAYNHEFQWLSAGQRPQELEVKVGRNKKNIFIITKAVTGGGRPDYKNTEQRMQLTGDLINELVEYNSSGNFGLLLGVYERNDTPVIVAIRPLNRQSGGNISKQVEIQTIADAMYNGFAVQKYPVRNHVQQIVCVFRPEFMHYYLSNIDSFSDKIVAVEQEDVPAILSSDIPLLHNRIIFGAPGTGKSFTLEKDRAIYFQDESTYERVTFHPNYSYANFVGTYKPISTNNGEISYEYVAGPFMRLLSKAIQSPNKKFLLIIEEINRANIAAVFGDVFQLLDRKNGVSEYPIETSQEIRKFLALNLGKSEDDFLKISIPNNLYIWTTMNTADQGVFPMDTAFKRRWDFEYIGINENDTGVCGIVNIAGKEIEWNKLRKAINDKLSKEYGVNEDKLLGPYFLSKKVIETEEIVDNDGATKKVIKDPELFKQAFKSKVLMYLFEDAARQYRKKLFSDCDNSRYSSICEAFDTKGITIFGSGFDML